MNNNQYFKWVLEVSTQEGYNNPVNLEREYNIVQLGC